MVLRQATARRRGAAGLPRQLGAAERMALLDATRDLRTEAAATHCARVAAIVTVMHVLALPCRHRRTPTVGKRRSGEHVLAVDGQGRQAGRRVQLKCSIDQAWTVNLCDALQTWANLAKAQNLMGAVTIT